MTELDVHHLRSWIGGQETLHDQVTRFSIAALSGTIQHPLPAIPCRRFGTGCISFRRHDNRSSGRTGTRRAGDSCRRCRCRDTCGLAGDSCSISRCGWTRR
jgi:hypothetical protein